MKKVTIYNINGNTMYKVEVPEDTPKDQEVKVALEKLVKEGLNLRNANLSMSNLEGAYLEGANLEGAILRYANLYECNLHGARLYQADLEKANLKRTNLKGANLEGTNLTGATIKEGISLLKDGYYTTTINANILEIFNTNQGIYFRCEKLFFCNEEGFKQFIIDNYKYSKYFKIYDHEMEGAKLRFNIN